jgi:RNA polymerase sigma-70 factor (ECF subfamily)
MSAHPSAAVRTEHDFEAIMRRYNGRLFRVARSILKDDAEAEDALQDAYLQAFRRFDDFRGDAALSTWLTRIVINQALMRARKLKRENVVELLDVYNDRTESASDSVMRSEVRRLLERQIDQLPAAFRTVFILREVEELSVEETAECLSIPTATVRSRLFRARGLLRAALQRDLDRATVDVFGFDGGRCDRVVAAVLARLS